MPKLEEPKIETPINKPRVGKDFTYKDEHWIVIEKTNSPIGITYPVGDYYTLQNKNNPEIKVLVGETELSGVTEKESVVGEYKKVNPSQEAELKNVLRKYASEPKKALLFCHNCGKEISLEAGFCPFCGVEILNEEKLKQQVENQREKDKNFKAIKAEQVEDFKKTRNEILEKETEQNLEADSKKWKGLEESKMEQKIFNTSTFEELYKALDKIGKIQGTRKEYTAEELKEKIEIARQEVVSSQTIINLPAVNLNNLELAKVFPFSVGKITRELGLRDKVVELVKEEILDKKMSEIEISEDNLENPKIDLTDVKQYIENQPTASPEVERLLEQDPPKEKEMILFEGGVWKIVSIKNKDGKNVYVLSGETKLAGKTQKTIKEVSEKKLLGKYEKILPCICGGMNTKGTPYCKYCGGDLATLAQPKGSHVKVEDSFYISPIDEKLKDEDLDNSVLEKDFGLTDEELKKREEEKQANIQKPEEVIKKIEDNLKQLAEKRDQLMKELQEEEDREIEQANTEVSNKNKLLYSNDEIFNHLQERIHIKSGFDALQENLATAENKLVQETITINNRGFFGKFFSKTDATLDKLKKDFEGQKDEFEKKRQELYENSKKINEELRIEREKIEMREKVFDEDRKEHPFKYFIIDETRMHDKAFEVVFSSTRDDVTLEQLNKKLGESGKELTFWGNEKPSEFNTYTKYLSSNGFTLEWINHDEVENSEDENAKYKLGTPEWDYYDDNEYTYKEGMAKLNEVAVKYQKEQEDLFESNNKNN